MILCVQSVTESKQMSIQRCFSSHCREKSRKDSVDHSWRNTRQLKDFMTSWWILYSFSLFHTHTNKHTTGLTELFVMMPLLNHQLTDMLLKLWIFTVMLTVLLLSCSPSVTSDSYSTNAFVQLRHTHSNTHSVTRSSRFLVAGPERHRYGAFAAGIKTDTCHQSAGPCAHCCPLRILIAHCNYVVPLVILRMQWWAAGYT